MLVCFFHCYPFKKSAIHSHTIYLGTYFGTRAEYDALNLEAQMASGSLIKVNVIDDWLGAVFNWAEGEVLQLGGGVVSLES